MRPNLVLGTNTQVCWHKFCRYWDVEAREVALEGEEVVTNPERAAAACDENTIGVVSVLGSTFTGHYEDVVALAAALDALQRTGPGSIFPSMSMAQAADLSLRFSSPNSFGTSACRASSPSTLQATSTAWSIPAWAGSFGAR